MNHGCAVCAGGCTKNEGCRQIRRSISAAETDYGLHLYLGFMSIIAVNPSYDIKDLGADQGFDVMNIMRIGRNFIIRSAAPSSQAPPTRHPRPLPEPSTPPSESLPSKTNRLSGGIPGKRWRTAKVSARAGQSVPPKVRTRAVAGGGEDLVKRGKVLQAVVDVAGNIDPSLVSYGHVAKQSGRLNFKAIAVARRSGNCDGCGNQGSGGLRIEIRGERHGFSEKQMSKWCTLLMAMSTTGLARARR